MLLVLVKFDELIGRIVSCMMSQGSTDGLDKKCRWELAPNVQ